MPLVAGHPYQSRDPGQTVSAATTPITVHTPPSFITSAGGQSSSITTCSVAFTAAAYSVILCCSGVEVTGQLAIAVSSVTGLGLTWTAKASTGVLAGYNNSRQTVALWYAVNNSASSVSGTVVVTYNMTIDDSATIVASFSGCNLTNPWSTTAPGYGGPTSSSSVLTVPLNAITDVGTTAVVFWGQNYPSPLINYPTGWTAIRVVQNGGAAYWEYVWLSYKQFTTAQGATTVSSASSASFAIGLTAVLVGA